MSGEKGKSALVPKLRFPEFRGAEGWKKSKLITLGGEPLSNGVFNDPKKVGTGYKLINVLDMYIDTTIDEGRLSLLELSISDFLGNQVVHGDIFFTRSSLVKSGIAVSNIYLGHSADVTFDGHLIRLRPDKSKVVPLFAHYLFKTAPIRTQLIARGKSATMTTIGQTDVAGVVLLYPKRGEQQKIADCLSALDELIAAQARKVDALKTHKKGLMQQLFPREGETQPRLRFPEFRDAGDWEVGDLGSKTSKVGSGITPTGGDTNYKQSGRPFVRSQNVGWGELLLENMAFIDEKTHSSFSATEIKILDVLLNITGASIGRSAVADERIVGGNVNQHVCIIRVKAAELNPLYLNQYLSSPIGQGQIDSFQAGGNRQGLNFAQIRSFSIPLPPNVSEQQRIANCLTSLDNLITFQTLALEALRSHKKGLMQQLFPSADAVEA